MYVIGTAGHVDHGKSTLVKALTNIDPDRLPEEKEREMTVDLGFAWMTLPSGREVSIVDVPGHERFIKNMLAGVGAIDLALLIVSAEESVMQQTREHLAILDLLQIHRGIVVITKTDLVDEELVELVKAEVEDTLAGTSFEGIPMIGVSAYTGAGLEDLKVLLDQILDQTAARRDLGRPRLPVDRCFSITGFGTVVTGTLIDGSFAVGQEVELEPSGIRCRIRGLQSHQSKVEYSDPGVRLAVNLSGISRSDVMRGEILTVPGWLSSVRRLDARVRMVKNASHSLRHNEGVTFHLFTSETTARVRLLDAERLAPDSEGWVQILLDEPIPMVKGDFFVLRSAEDTLGGGQVVDPNPRRRYRRFDDDVIERLMMLDQGTNEDVLISIAEQSGPCSIATLSQRANVAADEVLERLLSLTASGEMVALGDLAGEVEAVCYAKMGWEAAKNKIFAALYAYHQQFPLRRGVPTQEIRSRLSLPQAVYLKVIARLAQEGLLVEEGQFLRMVDHHPSFTPQLEQQAFAYIQQLVRDPYSPVTDTPIDAELLNALIDLGKVVRVNESVIFASAAYQAMTERIMAHLQEKGSITVAEARTMFDSSRKYMLPLLEYLDQQRITRRIGDERVLR
jgi:selenocysteine-specific elongation factor